MSASIPAASIATAGTVTITVFNPAPGGGTSNSVTLTINNPAPTLTSIDTTSAIAGGPQFTLTATGTNFNSSSKVRWNGADLPTTLVSTTSLTATVPAANIAAAGTASVTVFNPTPGGGTSAAQSFAINNPTPVLTSLSPNSTSTGGAAFTLTANGSDFLPDSVIRWNGVDLATTFVSATSLTASVPAANIAVGGTFSITVFTPFGGMSAPQTFTVNNPAPTLTSISPTAFPAGNGDTMLTAFGTNFVSGSVVRWNGVDLATTFVSSTSLTAVIPGANIASPGTATITVFNSAPGGGVSGPQTFTFAAGTPILNSISPATRIAGGPGFTLTVTGSRFVPGAVIRWDGGVLSTTYVDSTTLTGVVSFGRIVSSGTIPIQVTNPGWAFSSPAVNLQIDNPPPVLNTISPNSGLRGGAAFTLTVTGSGFTPDSIVKWNGNNLVTTFVNSTTLTANVLAVNISNAGNRPVVVFNPTPGGGTSSPQTFVVNNPVPVLTSLGLDSVEAGASSQTFAVSGTNFVSGAIVRWNGNSVTTTFVSSTVLNVTVPAGLLNTAGVNSIDAINPSPTAGPSNSLPFTVNNPVPTLTSLSRSSAPVGDPGFELTLTGTRYVTGSVVNWNGSPVATTFVNATTLKINVPASDLLTAGTASVSVTNSSPGGGTSNALTFTISAGFSLTQSVTLAEHTQPDQPITVEIRDVGSTVALATFTPTLSGGSYTITTNLPAGTYDIAISGSTWLRKVVSSVVIAGLDAVAPAVTLLNGDCNGDNIVDIADYAILAAAFSATPASANWDSRADLNGDLVVDIADYAILARNFGGVGD